MKYKLIYILLFLMAQPLLAQEVDFKTTVSKNKLGANQRFRIEFSINKQGADNFTPPNFKNFRIVGGPSQSVNQSWINGKATYTQSYIYILAPKKKGVFTIPPATIEYEEKTIKSNTVKMTIVADVELPKDPNDPDYIAEQNVHLVAQVSKRNPFVGEGIYVEYRLYVSENIGVSDWSVVSSPQYNGFWNQDIKINQLRTQYGQYKGERYRYIVLKKAVLIPQKSGKLFIDNMKMDVVIGVPTGRGDFFGNPITRNVNKSFSTKKRTVNVKELPMEGKPEGFNGAVGVFEFKVSSTKSELKANESAQLKVEVSGHGNLKLFEIPKIETPKELEIFTPEHKESLKTTLSGLKGKVYDQYTVVPQYKGKYKIPNVSFSYFNPKEKKYHTITSEDVYLDVLEGKQIISAAPGSSIKRNVVATDRNFRYIQSSTVFESLEKKDFFKSKLFYVLLFLPLLAIPVGVIIGRKREQMAGDIVGNKLRRADKLARKYLSEAKKQLGKKEAFYIALEKALHNYLKAKLNIETSDISRENIAELLQQRKVDEKIIESFMEVLNDCDFARYTPVTNVMMNDEFNKAKEVITKLDKQL